VRLIFLIFLFCSYARRTHDALCARFSTKHFNFKTSCSFSHHHHRYVTGRPDKSLEKWDTFGSWASDWEKGGGKKCRETPRITGDLMVSASNRGSAPDVRTGGGGDAKGTSNGIAADNNWGPAPSGGAPGHGGGRGPPPGGRGRGRGGPGMGAVMGGMSAMAMGGGGGGGMFGASGGGQQQMFGQNGGGQQRQPPAAAIPMGDPRGAHSVGPGNMGPGMGGMSGMSGGMGPGFGGPRKFSLSL